MSNLLRKIFFPTKEELISSMENCLEIHKTLIGHCCTCNHYIPTDIPGFVTDHGRCGKNIPIFVEKVTSHNHQYDCPFFEEDTSIYEELAELKKDV